MEVKNSFVALDYIVFAAMLAISLGIGVFFALKGGGQRTQGEYLRANRNMSIFPVAVSILLSFMSAILILGTPAEMYTQGTEYYMNLFGMWLGIALAVLLFVPLLYPLNITSAFEYLEKRFHSRAVRLLGTALMIISQIIYMGIAAYAPSTALEAVTGFPVWSTILIVGFVATFYTTIGGLKAVVWTDVFQAMVMLAGMLAIVIQGVLKVGSLDTVWQINEKWERIKFFNFDPDPTVRHTVWSLVIGGGLQWATTYGVNQASVQRYCSLPTLAKARLSVLLNVFGVSILVTLSCVAGIVMFAYYADQGCDPLGQRLVDNPNQLIPYLVMEILNYPGIPGLFISSLFSGALSSLSSSMNALAAITWEDMLKPHLDQRVSESKKTVITKAVVVGYGVCAICMSFAAQQLEGTVLQAAVSLIGAAGGPMTGMFFLGALFPWSNKYGAFTGATLGFGLSFWLSIGAYTSGIRLKALPKPNGTCSVAGNDTIATTVSTIATTLMTTAATSTSLPDTGRHGIEYFYSISYMWFTAVGLAATVIIGLVVSFITGPNSIDDVPMKYQIPIFSRLFCCLPKSWLKVLACNREFPHPEDISHQEKDREYVVTPPLSGMKTAYVNDGYVTTEKQTSKPRDPHKGQGLSMENSNGHSQEKPRLNGENFITEKL